MTVFHYTIWKIDRLSLNDELNKHNIHRFFLLKQILARRSHFVSIPPQPKGRPLFNQMKNWRCLGSWMITVNCDHVIGKPYTVGEWKNIYRHPSLRLATRQISQTEWVGRTGNYLARNHDVRTRSPTVFLFSPTYSGGDREVRVSRFLYHVLLSPVPLCPFASRLPLFTVLLPSSGYRSVFLITLSFTDLVITVWPSLQTSRYRDESLGPLCDVIALAM